MSENRLFSGPAVALFSGALVATIWIVVLDKIYGLDGGLLVQLVTTGAMGAVGASLGSLALNLTGRAASDRLDEAEHQARHDPLTGLANRAELFRVLDDSLIYASAHDTVLGVLFLDLDRFKTINDSLGHEVGDELLRIVADRLQSTVRASDVVARLGGDEFVVLCRGLLLADSVEAMAKQILKQFRQPISLNGKEHIVSTSIGVAIAGPGDNREADSLVSDADAAMYRAKRTKSGYAVFDEAQRQLVRDRLDVEHALMAAIEQEQIVVYYQPIVNAETGRLYGFEALVRWLHPEKGMISPGEFMGIAEEAGMMAEIGKVVLREACAQLAVWNHEAPGSRNVKIGVNLAEQQLIGGELPSLVAEVLDWSRIRPEQLVLEITEDVIVEHLDGLTVLRQLRDLGVELAIDDFGTGQSSLSYVKQFDMVSTIKIDQTFVREMNTENVDHAIVEAVTAMAKALQLSIVAEGVENPGQREALSRLGVHLIQGYLYSPPLPADKVDLEKWFGPDVIQTKEEAQSQRSTLAQLAERAERNQNATRTAPVAPAQIPPPAQVPAPVVRPAPAPAPVAQPAQIPAPAPVAQPAPAPAPAPVVRPVPAAPAPAHAPAPVVRPVPAHPVPAPAPVVRPVPAHPVPAPAPVVRPVPVAQPAPAPVPVAQQTQAPVRAPQQVPAHPVPAPQQVPASPPHPTQGAPGQGGGGLPTPSPAPPSPIVAPPVETRSTDEGVGREQAQQRQLPDQPRPTSEPAAPNLVQRPADNRSTDG